MRGLRSVMLGSLIALAVPAAASAACVSTPGQWTFADPSGDQWFSPTHSDVAALRIELDAACRLTMDLDLHGSLDREANLASYSFEVVGQGRTDLYRTLPRPDLPGRSAEEVWIGRPQAGGIGFRPEPALAPSGSHGWSGTLGTLGITRPGELRVLHASIQEYAPEGADGGPTGTGDAMPNEAGTISIPLAFTHEAPPAPEPAPQPKLIALPVADSPPPVALPDVTPPAVSKLALRPGTLRGRPGARIAVRRAAGTYRLSEAATVAFKLQRRTARGRYVWLGRSSSDAGAAGLNRVRLAKLVAGLRPGVYRLVATARDGAGNAGAAKRVAFRVR